MIDPREMLENTLKTSLHIIVSEETGSPYIEVPGSIGHSQRTMFGRLLASFRECAGGSSFISLSSDSHNIIRVVFGSPAGFTILNGAGGDSVVPNKPNHKIISATVRKADLNITKSETSIPMSAFGSLSGPSFRRLKRSAVDPKQTFDRQS